MFGYSHFSLGPITRLPEETNSLPSQLMKSE
nr:MAG TPA: hypothetical protein [Caudoviricetes sp.]